MIAKNTHRLFFAVVIIDRGKIVLSKILEGVEWYTKVYTKYDACVLCMTVHRSLVSDDDVLLVCSVTDCERCVCDEWVTLLSWL